MTCDIIKQQNKGFTLIELLIVVAVIGILAAIAYPNYLRYVTKTKRTDAMSYLQNRANYIESQKLVLGNYEIPAAKLPSGNYPESGVAQYTISTNMDVNGDGTKGDWQITAQPVAGGQLANDGKLTLDSTGQQCRGSTCGSSWND